MPPKVWLHPIPYLIGLFTLVSGLLANMFGLGPQYTYPFAVAVLLLTGYNVQHGSAHPSWVIAVPRSWVSAVTPVIALLSGAMSALVPALTGPGSPYHFSVTIVAIMTALVIVLNWLATSIQTGSPQPLPSVASNAAVKAVPNPVPSPKLPTQKT